MSVEDHYRVLICAGKEGYAAPPKGWHELKFPVGGIGHAERIVLLQYDPMWWSYKGEHEGIEVFRNFKLSLWLSPVVR